MRIKLANFLSFVIFLSVGCNTASTDEALIPTYVAETAMARQSATAIIEQALAVALTGSAQPPSATSTPTATATPTETPTPSPTPNPTVEVIVGLAQIRGGPGIAYRVIQNASEGDTFEVIGRSENGRWLVVGLVLDEQGWILSDQVQGLENTEGLVIVEAPPTPTLSPLVTITVINKMSGRPIFIRVDIGNYLQLGYLAAPLYKTTISFSIPTGTYTFIYGVSGAVQCTKTIFINSNIVWEPASIVGICGSFP